MFERACASKLPTRCSTALASAVHSSTSNCPTVAYAQATGDGINFASFAEKSDVFAKFFDVFASFSKFSDVFGPVWTCLDVFGYVRMHSDASGRVRMRSDAFGKFRFFSKKITPNLGF